MSNEKIAILLKKAELVIDKFTNQILAPYDLTHTQFKILMTLYRSPDTSVRQADIEKKFGMTNPTVTGIIHNMEKKNLVKRVENPNDKRSKFIVLTPQARQMEARMHELSEQREKQIRRNLTDEEYELLIILLKKVLE